MVRNNRIKGESLWERNSSRVFSVFIIFLLCLQFFSGTCTVWAEEGGTGETVSLRQAVANEDIIKAYVRNAAGEGASYQIANIPVDSVRSYGLGEDSAAPRTLIMLDNSLSIPNNSRAKVLELIGALIDAHGDKEVFRLATFADDIHYLSDNYSDDYTMLKSLASVISFSDQETYLTDVLYDVIDSLNSENYMGFTRIIVISDGVDNKPLGVTREELNAKIKDTLYPIYTVGTDTGKNNDELENMFALSRLTNSEFHILEQTETGGIVSDFSKDAGALVFEARIPEEAKMGGKQSSKLTFSDGRDLVFEVKMPFSLKAGQITPSKEAVEKAPSEPQEKEEEGLPMWLVAAIIGGAFIIIIILIILIIATRRKRKKASLTTSERDMWPIPDDGNEEATVKKGAGKNNRQNFPGRINPSLLVTLSDKRDRSQNFTCKLDKDIYIGRSKTNDICIPYDRGISRKHSRLVNKNGRVFIMDLDSENGTKVDNQTVTIGTEVNSGNTISLGEREFLIRIDK
ncbi:MAG: FHA domain-containing protein [Lachnospiraceae bacterium]|nr:FHA domain-containing protein [Lachnospiraceae bacterium]